MILNGKSFFALIGVFLTALYFYFPQNSTDAENATKLELFCENAFDSKQEQTKCIGDLDFGFNKQILQKVSDQNSFTQRYAAYRQLTGASIGDTKSRKYGEEIYSSNQFPDEFFAPLIERDALNDLLPYLNATYRVYGAIEKTGIGDEPKFKIVLKNDFEESESLKTFYEARNDKSLVVDSVAFGTQQIRSLSFCSSENISRLFAVVERKKLLSEHPCSGTFLLTYTTKSLDEDIGVLSKQTAKLDAFSLNVKSLNEIENEYVERNKMRYFAIYYGHHLSKIDAAGLKFQSLDIVPSSKIITFSGLVKKEQLIESSVRNEVKVNPDFYNAVMAKLTKDKKLSELCSGRFKAVEEKIGKRFKRNASGSKLFNSVNKTLSERRKFDLIIRC